MYIQEVAELKEEDISYMSKHSGILSESVYHNDAWEEWVLL